MPTNNLHLLQDADPLSKSITTCSKVIKPTSEEAKELSRLFPSSNGVSRKRGPSFDPNEHLDGIPDTKKKKRGSTSKGRSVKVSVCRLTQFTPFIPRGNARNKLKEKGRIVSIQLTRSMSSGSVKQVITRA